MPYRATIESELHDHCIKQVEKQFIGIPDGPKLGCIKILLRSESFDRPRDASQGVWSTQK
jgi:hypothetical protein